LKLAVKKGVLVDYKVLTKWSSSPDDWNIMVIEIFPNMASYDTFWKDWAAIDAETVETREFSETSIDDESFPLNERFGTSMLMAIRPWGVEVFESMRRTEPKRLGS